MLPGRQGGSIPYLQMINRIPAIDVEDLNGEILEKVHGNLELRNIDFAYPSRLEAPIFQNFSLQIPAGDYNSLTSH